jgi:hypothetical protein
MAFRSYPRLQIREEHFILRRLYSRFSQKIAEYFEDDFQVRPQHLLNNDIHPLFWREAWVVPWILANETYIAYQAIILDSWLASRFITSEGTVHHIACYIQLDHDDYLMLQLPIYRTSMPLNIHYFWLQPLPFTNVKYWSKWTQIQYSQPTYSCLHQRLVLKNGRDHPLKHVLRVLPSSK